MKDERSKTKIMRGQKKQDTKTQRKIQENEILKKNNKM